MCNLKTSYVFFPYEDSYALRPRLNNYNNILNERFSDILLSVGLLRDFMYSCFFPFLSAAADFPLSWRRKCVCHKSTPAPFA